jgi:hypothetical protein
MLFGFSTEYPYGGVPCGNFGLSFPLEQRFLFSKLALQRQGIDRSVERRTIGIADVDDRHVELVAPSHS